VIELPEASMAAVEVRRPTRLKPHATFVRATHAVRVAQRRSSAPQAPALVREPPRLPARAARHDVRWWPLRVDPARAA
jgi:hypothetical protein